MRLFKAIVVLTALWAAMNWALPQWHPIAREIAIGAMLFTLAIFAIFNGNPPKVAFYAYLVASAAIMFSFLPDPHGGFCNPPVRHYDTGTKDQALAWQDLKDSLGDAYGALMCTQETTWIKAFPILNDVLTPPQSVPSAVPPRAIGPRPYGLEPAPDNGAWSVRRP